MPKQDPWYLIAEAAEMEAQEAEDVGSLAFLARVFAMTSLPYRDPGAIPFWSRRNGSLSLVLHPAVVRRSGQEQALYPYGTVPRLVMGWLTTEAVRTKQAELKLGRSLAQFMGKLGLMATGGRWGSVRRVEDQTERLFASSISVLWEVDRGSGQVGRGSKGWRISEESLLYWSLAAPEAMSFWDSYVTLSEAFFREIIDRPVPIDLRALRALRGSPLRLDIYYWLTHRMSCLGAPTMVPWERLQAQFGSTFAATRFGRARFRQDFEKHLARVLVVYPDAKVEATPAGLKLRPSKTHVSRRRARTASVSELPSRSV